MISLYSLRFRGLSLSLCLVFSLLGLTTYAQTNNPVSKPVTNPVIPPSPDAASLGKFGEIPVSAYTGVPDISVPIYTVKSRDITIPISLNYHASGIKVQEDAGWVGLGWALRAGGSISRTIRGQDDLFYPSGFIHQAEFNDYTNYVQINEMGKGNIDSQPDLFNLDVAGVSLRFVLPEGQMNGSGGFLNSQYLVATILNPTDNTQVRLKKDASQNYIWEVTTPNGMLYKFGILGREVTYPYGGTSTSKSSQPALDQPPGQTNGLVTTWNLTEIVSPLDEHVTFSYISTHKSRGLVSITEEYQKPSATVVGPALGVFNNVFTSRQQFSFSRTDTRHTYLTSINFANGSVVFDVSDDAYARLDVYPLEFNGAQRLNGITVKNSSGTAVRKWLFAYDYFLSNLTGTDVSMPHLGKRLRLDSVKEVDALTGTSYLPPYQFFYKGYQNGQYQIDLLPPKHSQAYDEYGYYNGQTGNDSQTQSSIIPQSTITYAGETFTNSDISSINRNVVLEHAQKGTLEKLVYPTGGYSTFAYETHQAVVPDNNTTQVTNAAIGTTSFTVATYSSVNIQANLNGYPRTVDPVTGTYSCTSINTNNPNLPSSDPWLSIRNASNIDVYVLRYSDVFGMLNQATCDFSFNRSTTLTAGNYSIVISPHNNSAQNILHTANASLFVTGVASTTTLKDVGGLRISSITHTDGSNTYVKSYTYTGGKIMSPIKHGYPRIANMSYSDANGTTFASAWLTTFTSWNIIPAGNSAQGSYVGYDNVSTADLTLTNGIWVPQQGRTQYFFVNRSDSVATASYFVPNLPIYPNVGNGNPLLEQTINAAGTVVKQVQYQYSVNRQSSVKGFVPIQTAYSNLGYLNGGYLLAPYSIYSDYWKTNKIITQEANLGGTASLTTTTQNTYNNAYKTLEKVATDNSRKQSQEVTYTYPYSTTITPYPTMVSLNRVASVIDETITLNTSTFVRKTSKPFSQFAASNNLILPSQLITRRQGETSDMTEATYGYDAVGNLSSVVKRDGTKEQYNWYTDAARKNYLQSQTISQSDGALARTTTYDYEPLVGLKSITDPNSLSTSYEYDEFKRLKAIRDHNQNLVKTFHYNYGATGSSNNSLLISPNFKNILIIGNSITQLVAQSGTDGWQSTALSTNTNADGTKGWGRAASTKAKDFAHILESRFQQINPTAKLLPLWEAPWEYDYINGRVGWPYYNYSTLKSKITTFFGTPGPDLIIIRLGENVNNGTVEPYNFKDNFKNLIDQALSVSSPGAKVIVTNSMWPDQPLANTRIKEVATERFYPFVDLSDMYANPVYLGGNDPATLAAFPNDGGDRHPGDVGMLEIADRIWGKLFNESKQITVTQPTCSSLSGSIISPAMNTTVTGTASLTNSSLVTCALAVSACIPMGQTITSVEIRAQIYDGNFDNNMGFAVADVSRPGVYTLSAAEGNVPGKWPTARLAPSANPYRFYAVITTNVGSFTTGYNLVTLTAPVVNNVAIKARILTRPYSNPTYVTSVMQRYAGGTFYGTNDLNSTTPTSLAVIPSSPVPSPSSWLEYTFNTNMQAYRYLMYKPGSSSYGELAKLEFYSSSGILDGAKLGSTNTYTNSDVYSFTAAFDNDDNTFWNGAAPGPSTNWIAIDLGSSGCSQPAAPIIATSAVLLCSGQQATLTASGCSGTVTWSNAQTGSTITVSPSVNTTYTATCMVNGCTSVASNQLTISVPTTMPSTWTAGTIGTPPVPSCANTVQSGSLIVRGVGNVPGTTADAFPYVYKTLSGDVTIIAKIAGLPTSTTLGDGPRAGIIFRNSAATNASFVWLVQEANGAIGNYRRTVDGGTSSFGPSYAQGLVGGQLGQAWIKMVKVGSTISSYYSTNANPEANGAWVLLNTHTDVSLSSSFLVGFTAFNYNYGVTGAANNTTVTEALFTNITVNGVPF